MKRIFILGSIFALMVFSCSNSTTSNTVNDAIQPIQITTEQFKKLVFDYTKSKEWKFEGKTPVVIDFYADWCGPCKRMSPILDQLQKDYKGKVVIYKVNIDNERELAGLFGIQSIPSFLMIPLTGKPQMIMGMMDKEKFESEMIKYLEITK